MSNPWWRPWRRWLAGSGQMQPDTLARQARAYTEARILVRAYYAGLLYFAFTGISSGAEMAGLSESGLLWPVGWVRATGMTAGAWMVTAMHLTGALASVYAPGRRWCRGLAALGLFEFTALNYSAGKIGHGMHLWVLTSIVLVFLPNLVDPNPTRRQRQDFLNVFWTAYALALLTYSMSGLGKVAGALYQVSLGEVTVFHPQAMALHISQRLLESGVSSPIGLWLVDHTWVSWPLMLGAIYLQFFSFWSIFRPNLIKIWSFLLILFHISTFLVLTIRFGPPVLFLAIFGLASPFSPTNSTFADILTELPIIGKIWTVRRK